jgi:AcrR family transcriptional regulator
MAEATIRPSGKHSESIVRAARALVDEKGAAFTTQELIKQAGVALQTFYRHFGSKDQLLVAVIQETVAENCALFERAAADVNDPIERLHLYISSALGGFAGAGVGPRSITAEHWRLQQLFPEQMAEATRPFADLVQRELERAEAAGLASPRDPERDAWLIGNLVMAAFHHYAFHPNDPGAGTIADDVWGFCLTAVGGTPTSGRRRARRRRQ